MLKYILIALCLTTTAQAQSAKSCATRDIVINKLATKYSESRQSIGMASNKTVVEVYANTDKGTWTITVTTATGVTCLLATGQGFENLSETLTPAGAKI